MIKIKALTLAFMVVHLAAPTLSQEPMKAGAQGDEMQIYYNCNTRTKQQPESKISHQLCAHFVEILEARFKQHRILHISNMQKKNEYETVADLVLFVVHERRIEARIDWSRDGKVTQGEILGTAISGQSLIPQKIKTFLSIVLENSPHAEFVDK